MLPTYGYGGSAARGFPGIPLRTSTPSLTGAGIPQPSAPTPIRPVGPILPPPISPISGNPVTVSIFQPTHTPAMAGLPSPSAPTTGLDLMSGGQFQTGAVAFAPSAIAQPPAPGLIFGLDVNTWLVLLVVLAAVIVMVLG